MAAHRYWRVYITHVQGGTHWPAVSECVLRDTPGGSQTATGGTAIASGSYSGSPASNAFDGVSTNIWSAGGNPPQWLGYDYGVGNSIEIVEIALMSRGDGGSWTNDSPTRGSVQYSDDGSTWTTAFYFVTPSAWTAGAQTKTMQRLNNPHRYWRLRNISNYTGQTGVGEIEMAATLGGADQCNGGTAIASGSYGGGLAPSFAFNNNTGDNWFQSGQTDRWIGYDFGANVFVDVEEVRVALAKQDRPGHPRIFAVESSDDSSTWTLEWYGIRPVWADDTFYSFPRPDPEGVPVAVAIWCESSENSNNDTVIAEIELRVGETGADETGGGTATAYPVNASYPASQLIDNNTGTIYYAGQNGQKPVVLIALPSAVAVTHAMIRASDSSVGNQTRAPKTGRFFWSPNGGGFIAGDSFSGANWAGSEQRVFAIGYGGGPGPGPSARRRRMVIVN